MIAIVCVACSRGVNRGCISYPDGHSDCGERLFCDESLGNGVEYLKGNDYVIDGKCRPQKKSGDTCIGRDKHECEAPLRCVVEITDPTKPPPPGRCGIYAPQ